MDTYSLLSSFQWAWNILRKWSHLLKLNCFVLSMRVHTANLSMETSLSRYKLVFANRTSVVIVSYKKYSRTPMKRSPIDSFTPKSLRRQAMRIKKNQLGGIVWFNTKFYRQCMEDSKENWYWDSGNKRVKRPHPIRRPVIKVLMRILLLFVTDFY